ncbi:MAG: hypothetical protein LBI04_07650 [Treponema sp.]|jgi:hypothetical protein|nr:hypothetical protein [Treponema sp.]
MKIVPGGQAVLIETKRKYSIEELLEIMRNGNLEEKFGPIELKKKMIRGKFIVVQGLNKFTNEVVSVKKTIQVTQTKKEGVAMSLIHHVTEGALANVQAIGRMAGLGGAKDNKEVMKALAEEIEKLVEVK